MSNETFPCPACGAPNESEAGKIRIPCAYCGATLTISERLRVKATPKMEYTPSKAAPMNSPEIQASNLLRKAQPIAIRAWNLYALWTWFRWLLPTCLVIFVVVIVICVALGALPVIWRLAR